VDAVVSRFAIPTDPVPLLTPLILTDARPLLPLIAPQTPVFDPRILTDVLGFAGAFLGHNDYPICTDLQKYGPLGYDQPNCLLLNPIKCYEVPEKSGR
jgi:hypothetical protein